MFRPETHCILLTSQKASSCTCCGSVPIKRFDCRSDTCEILQTALWGPIRSHSIYKPVSLIGPHKPPSGLIGPWRALEGLRGPQTASDGLSRGNLSKNQYFGQKSLILALFWLQIEVYGLGGRYMASGRPRRSASSGLKRPQMTSNVLKCPQMTSILLWCP